MIRRKIRLDERDNIGDLSTVKFQNGPFPGQTLGVALYCELPQLYALHKLLKSLRNTLNTDSTLLPLDANRATGIVQFVRTISKT